MFGFNFLIYLNSDKYLGITCDEYKSILESKKLTNDIYKKITELGFYAKNTVFLKQVHETNIVIADKNNIDKVRGMEGDAIIAIEPNIPIIVFTADCVPIFIVDKVKKFIAAVHAGWKGTVKNIAFNVVEYMIKNLNCNPLDLIANIGPSIGPCCFEVKEDVARYFNFFIRENKYFVNLWKENKDQLLKAGLLEENIYVSNVCTCCNKNYYSYRREGILAGRQLNIIQFKE
ncbi:conserved hypothetical protein [Caloramator fervidus]|uniref:Purine nucleoside phosphorylase n=1 Tax=Caloramator fervidus TaxID=29344 RepID=A0A1H5U1H8_9CLOT|nr:peptidoglycan editing factor PgeF [Caloramator fervidus]SEF68992.1 conserved hypothetical protein [Caloramator fervidus]